MIRHDITLLILLLATLTTAQAQNRYSVDGRIIDRTTRKGVAYASVVIVGQEQSGTASDSTGHFRIERVKPGIYRLSASYLGYKSVITPEYIISASTPPITIEIEEDPTQVETVTVTPSPFRITAESPVGLKVIGLREIEKSPGSNRDISRIVRSYPGVAFSPVGYRNDLIVRGGGPAENRFYMDGIEIPNINHFATQGATGGPVSIVNADLVREINFYTGAFPADRSGALSSVLDFRLRDGNLERQTFKATLGASEVSLSGSGHIGRKTTYLFSLRQSYLQLLFKMLKLPMLPNYIDGQIKVKSRLSEHDELTLLAIAGFDKMKLNTDEKGDDAQYILSYLPRINQETYTVGAVWRHFAGAHVQSVVVSHNYLNNRNVKYRNNDSSTEDNLTLRLRAVEQKSTLRGENRSKYGLWTLREGVELNYSTYNNRTLQRLFTDATQLSNYSTHIGIFGWGAFVGGDYTSADNRFTASVGLRADGCDYSASTSEFWRQLSPRASLSYKFADGWAVSGNAGLYYQLPPYTALGFKEADALVNKELGYMNVAQFSAGIDWRLRDRFIVTAEAFCKLYGNIPLSVADNVPLACKGADYGVVGNELLRQTSQGRAYGVEIMARWQLPDRINMVGSVTLFRSQYRNNAQSSYIASAWDNRFVVNISGTYDLPRNWSIGAKLSAIGGAPYTPYDIEKSSLVEAWDAQGRPYYDYSRYNHYRLNAFAQLDLRVDKTYYFRHCMLGIYLDLQNVTMSRLKQADVLLSTGVIENPDASPSAQRYIMRTLAQDSGTLVPTIGITVEF